MKKRKFTILGGDQRNIALARLLVEDENQVEVYGFDKINVELDQSHSLEDAIKNADVVVGPLPMSEDKQILKTPFSSKKIYLEEILNVLSKDQIYAAGRVDKEFLRQGQEKELQVQDYFAREEMQVLNAIPTAEGAIQVAMEEMDITLHQSNAMILGYGRIGKALGKMLQGIGSNVYVAARNYEDLAWIKNDGYAPVHLKELEKKINAMDVVFNTIPSMILDGGLLKNLDKNCIVIDLASKPGGVDFEKAEELGIKTVHALALPGKVAPITAANTIKDTIYNIIQEWEELKCP